MIKIHSKLGIEVNFLNLTKGLYKKTKLQLTPYLTVNVFPPRLGDQGKDVHSPHSYSTMYLKF